MYRDPNPKRWDDEVRQARRVAQELARLMQAKRKAAIAAFKGSKNQAVAMFKCSRRTVQRYRKKVQEPGLFD